MAEWRVQKKQMEIVFLPHTRTEKMREKEDFLFIRIFCLFGERKNLVQQNTNLLTIA